MPTKGSPVICPICHSKRTSYFFTLKNSTLLQNVLFLTEEEAKKARHVDVDFLYCRACHFVFNPEFLESEIRYTKEYNNNQLSSEQ